MAACVPYAEGGLPAPRPSALAVLPAVVEEPGLSEQEVLRAMKDLLGQRRSPLRAVAVRVVNRGFRVSLATPELQAAAWKALHRAEDRYCAHGIPDWFTANPAGVTWGSRNETG